MKEICEYIVTVEMWKDGKSQWWHQASISCTNCPSASELLETIRLKFKREGYSVKITDIFKV